MYSRVYVEITNICNMNCSFCHGHSRKSRMMTLDEFKGILDQLSNCTEYIYYHLMGEPLTHPDLPLFIQASNDKGFKSIITTNGTLLAKRSDELLASGLHKISISLHSFEENNTQKHFEYLSQVAEFADKASKQGIITVFRFWNKDCDDGKNDNALEFLKSKLSGEWSSNPRGVKIHDRLYIEWGDRFGWPDKNAPIQSENVFCYGMRDHFGILSDGTVVPCCLDSDGVINLGNVFKENIADILEKYRAKAIKNGFDRRIATEDLCRRCPYAQRFS